MLTGDEDMEISALAKQGWTISAIARHVGHDRKTVRRYLGVDVETGVRANSTAYRFDRFEPYLAQRLSDDAHVWATVLHAEIVALGYEGAYPTFTRKLRERGLRPHCEPCAGVSGRPTVDIEHPPGAETQWDWLELSETPWGEKAWVLVGALSHSSKFRVWFSESDDQPHLIVSLREVSRRLGGVTRDWRFDRMATVINPTSGRVQSSFVPVAKHFGVRVLACPPRRGNRKGVVEKNIHYLTQGWWRTARVSTSAEAQTSADVFCVKVADLRPRIVEEPERSQGGSGVAYVRLAPEDPPVRRLTVAEAAALEPLLPLPATAYPIEVEITRRVAANGLVALWGNQYSVAPAVIGGDVILRWRHGTDTIDIYSAGGVVVATHRLAPRGANRTVRLPEHTRALENVVLASFSTDRPCKAKVNRPPSQAALAIAGELAGHPGTEDPVIDLARYQQIIDRRGEGA